MVGSEKRGEREGIITAEHQCKSESGMRLEVTMGRERMEYALG